MPPFAHLENGDPKSVGQIGLLWEPFLNSQGSFYGFLSLGWGGGEGACERVEKANETEEAAGIRKLLPN